MKPKPLPKLRLSLLLCALAGLTPPLARGQDHIKGKWGPVLKWPNVPIHVHVLPTGKVLFWGRREWNAENTAPAQGLDPHNCTARIWDPEADPATAFTVLPKLDFNLFCSGHTFLPDGRLLIAGGHYGDGKGAEKAVIFNPAIESPWKRLKKMNKGRWYPTAITLADGSVLVSGGTDQHGQVNNRQEIFKDGEWKTTAVFEDQLYYPRLHVDADKNADAVLVGPARLTQRLNTSGAGAWTPPQNHPNDSRRNAQIFSPPYLFKSTAENPRPAIASTPSEVGYGKSFPVQVAAGATIGSVSWIRLGSVTHSFNSNQRINFLEFSASGTILMVKAPPSPKVCPPGHYMLFVLDQNKVPSVARIIRIK